VDDLKEETYKMSHADFRKLWDSLDEDRRDSIRHKARWEGMTLWAVCNEYPGIWNDEARLKDIRLAKESPHAKP
jgi:hypothetical protein